ncbi:hypothetical protein G2W53_019704 [Senna tora]|uniref:Uncharacterized protein n=1 Tax=Senna tora TaxID=362788 RepID=A0A834TTX3_9FABA|nr:hypothetical protein G2W53_019704 [Senna tora]
MDSKSLSKKATKEVARESLIAISNSSPEKIVEFNCGSEIKKADGVAVANGDVDDKFRSELISISYAESPDVKI